MITNNKNIVKRKLLVRVVLSAGGFATDTIYNLCLNEYHCATIQYNNTNKRKLNPVFPALTFQYPSFSMNDVICSWIQRAILIVARLFFMHIM